MKIFANANNLTTGAVVSVSVVEKPNWSQAKLLKTSKGELETASRKLSAEMKGKPTRSGLGLTLEGPVYEIQSQPNRSGLVVVTSYSEEEKSSSGRSIVWRTKHFNIPFGQREIEVVASYQAKHENFWKPVIDRAISSLAF